MIKKGTITIQTQKVTRNIETPSNTKNHPNTKSTNWKKIDKDLTLTRQVLQNTKQKTPPKKQGWNTTIIGKSY